MSARIVERSNIENQEHTAAQEGGMKIDNAKKENHRRWDGLSQRPASLKQSLLGRDREKRLAAAELKRRNLAATLDDLIGDTLRPIAKELYAEENSEIFFCLRRAATELEAAVYYLRRAIREGQ